MVRRIDSTIRELTPADAGANVRESVFAALPMQPGFRYELIDGVLHVSPAPDPTHNDLVDRIYDQLRAARTTAGRPLFAKVSQHARVIVRDDEDATTNPEPDIAAYLTYPARPPASYREVAPALVVEVVSRGSAEKDYVRNRELYAAVPEILEYWVVDPTGDPTRPTMTVHHRVSGKSDFELNMIEAGADYASATWPDLRLNLDWLKGE